jgi:hypothetical protein
MPNIVSDAIPPPDAAPTGPITMLPASPVQTQKLPAMLSLVPRDVFPVAHLEPSNVTRAGPGRAMACAYQAAAESHCASMLQPASSEP